LTNRYRYDIVVAEFENTSTEDIKMITKGICCVCQEEHPVHNRKKPVMHPDRVEGFELEKEYWMNPHYDRSGRACRGNLTVPQVVFEN